MPAELRLGLSLWAGLIGYGRGRAPASLTIPLVVGVCVLLILLRLFRGPPEPRGIRGWLTRRSGRTIILATSVLVVAAMDLPLVVGVAAVLVIQAGLEWYRWWFATGGEGPGAGSSLDRD